MIIFIYVKDAMSSHATLQFFIPYILPLVDYIRPRMYHNDETKSQATNWMKNGQAERRSKNEFFHCLITSINGEIVCKSSMSRYVKTAIHMVQSERRGSAVFVSTLET